ncbi:MAG TPA: peptidylprolyl isomerase [Croceibacterium sp.]|nr:peptidylprolyl isomerase [Croceibacterium sp.]
MRKTIAIAALAAFALAAPLSGQDMPEPPTPASIVAAAPASDWRAIDPADLLVMTLAADAGGNPRQVVVQLLPAPFSQSWVGNIRTLAKAHWWDGTSVYRVVDNWVAQWGDGEDDEAKAKPLPEGMRVVAESEYTVPMSCEVYLFEGKVIEDRCIPEFNAIEAVDAYVMSGQTGFTAGWPVAMKLEPEGNRVWPVHCYGSVGVARNLSPDTGTGAELYAVIGHAPRALDRNIAVVGRVIEGIEHLSTLPRGKGDAGVYDDPALRVPIVSVRLGNEVGQLPQPQYEYLASDSASFAEYVRVRANRNDPFYKVPAGGVDVCNVQVPIRRVPSE